MSKPDTIHHEISTRSNSGERQLVVFRLADEEFGVEINNVKEIVRLPEITPIPRSPQYVSGICNLRGNVLPVIDTRTRFSMEMGETSDHTRLLVVDAGGFQTGLVVDSVREVMRMTDSHEEPPPAVCRGIDREFLTSVVKVNDGKRLILNLDIGEVLSIDIEDSATRETETRELADRIQESTPKETIEEEHLVSFALAGDEYAFAIDKVREIIKVSEITAVPNVPNYVKGLLTIRSNLLPIIDLREMLGFQSIVAEYQEEIDLAVDEHRIWVDNLNHSLEAGAYFAGSLDYKESRFGVWLEKYSTSSVEVEAIIKRLKRIRANLFDLAKETLEIGLKSKEDAISLFQNETKPKLSMVIDLLNQLKAGIEMHISQDQRALVVEVSSMTVGFLVDCVDEVLRIPKSIIDETPAMAASDRKELKAVAKLDKGERLIMIMDESALISHEASKILADIKNRKELHDGDDKEAKSLAQQSMDEEQLVTFSINTEEYGIRIRQVQEINRLSDVTPVPRAPYFIDGMTNLRGEVIPVMNIRKLFGLEERDLDERTRIIIVDISGKKTGLRVDQVNEVLRLAKNDIEKTPRVVVTDGANTFMEGVCKIENGKRMVVLLNVEKILDEEELKKLNALRQGDADKPAKSLNAAPKKTASLKKNSPKKKNNLK